MVRCCQHWQQKRRGLGGADRPSQATLRVAAHHSLARHAPSASAGDAGSAAQPSSLASTPDRFFCWQSGQIATRVDTGEAKVVVSVQLAFSLARILLKPCCMSNPWLQTWRCGDKAPLCLEIPKKHPAKPRVELAEVLGRSFEVLPYRVTFLIGAAVVLWKEKNNGDNM